MNTEADLHYFYWASLTIVLLGILSFEGFTEAHGVELPAKEVRATVAGGKTSSEYLRLIAKLDARGALVKSTRERVRQPFFSVSGRIMRVNDEPIQVFEYSNSTTTESQAKRVNPDGKTIGNSKPSWMSTPHFFKSQKLIVLYVGDDQTVLKALQAELGDQFAGG